MDGWRQLARLAHGDHSRVQGQGHTGSQKEAARIDAGDHVGVATGLRQRVDDEPQSLRVREHRGEIGESDAGRREVVGPAGEPLHRQSRGRDRRIAHRT